LQPAKNIVPEPPLPTSTLSSPKCGPCELTTGIPPMPQKPISPLLRKTLQFLGQITQGFIISHSRLTTGLKRLIFSEDNIEAIQDSEFLRVILKGPRQF
jgi:hypothetical protein